MRRTTTQLSRRLLVAALIGSTVASPLRADPPFLERIFQLGHRQGHPPKTGKDPSIEELAKNIDWLEHEIDRWGTVVAKAPDVWGEARLTKYRAEVEEQFREDVTKFAPNQINGAQLISDQAFLAASFALNSKPSGTGGVPVPTASVSVSNSTATTASETAVSANATAAPEALKPFGLEDTNKVEILGKIFLEQTEVLDQKKRYLDHLNELRRLNEGDDVSDSPGYSLNLVRIPISILPGKHSQEGYGAEITVTATPELGPELLPTAFKDFVINDLVDQLSVPLVQFLNTDPKFAREVVEKLEAIENKPQTLQLLARQFTQGWVVFEGSDWPSLLATYSAKFNVQFSVFDPNTASFPPISNLDDQQQQLLLKDARKLTELLASLSELNKSTSTSAPSKPAPDANQVAARSFAPATQQANQNARQAAPELENLQNAKLKSLYRIIEDQASDKINARGGLRQQQVQNGNRETVQAVATSDDVKEQIELLLKESVGSKTEIKDALEQLEKLEKALTGIEAASLAITTVNIPSSSRRSTLPFPPSQLLENYGMHDLAHVALDAYRAFENEIINRQVIHLTDVQGYLREELSASYDMMALPAVQCFWEYESSGEKTLVNALKHRRADSIAELREGFRTTLAPHLQHSSTLTLAWCVFVESLLLNERILEDMKINGAGDVWLPLFGPNPSIEARNAFAAYVAQRWPVKVFAIDPVVNEQNIADVSSISRQMQLAVALAFAGGEISASAAMQTLRQLQRDTATIDLNRTIVGFGHGENTFGWRFFPRFQTPPVESNVTVFFRDLVVGGPTDKQLLRSKQIEPGMRECVAIVLMPSFVPGVTFDSRGNWFKLANPSHTALSMQENVQYSRSIVAMRDNAIACSRCPERYRPGELDRMLKRVQQLDAELPLQTLRVPLPIENSHGGFEIFSSGTRELAPELLGWYGSPGYDVAKGGAFFLAGDNFSIHETKLIAGNKNQEVKLLSRQILQVDLPPGLQIVQDERLKKYHTDKLGLGGDINHYIGFVDAHVATPYGVSGHLLIPVISTPAEPPKCECNVEVVSADIQATIQLAEKDGVFSINGGIAAAISPLIAFKAPNIPALGGEAATLTIQPVVDDGRLAVVEVNDIPIDGNTYNLSGEKAISLLTPGPNQGALLKSISDYVVWRANRGTLKRTDNFEVTCQLTVTIAGVKFTTQPVTMFVTLLPPPPAAPATPAKPAAPAAPAAPATPAAPAK